MTEVFRSKFKKQFMRGQIVLANCVDGVENGGQKKTREF